MTPAAGTAIPLLAVGWRRVGRARCGHHGLGSLISLQGRRGGVTEIDMEMAIVLGIEAYRQRRGQRARRAGRGADLWWEEQGAGRSA